MTGCPSRIGADSEQTVIVGFLSYLALPNTLDSASFLTAEENDFGRERLMLDNSMRTDGYDIPMLQITAD